jgi:hypothetical protein
VAQHLFIVARQQPDLFSYLSREFSAESDVTVIVDRRRGERRTAPQPPTLADRRQSDRRLKAEIIGQLSTLGYAFVRLT